MQKNIKTQKMKKQQTVDGAVNAYQILYKFLPVNKNKNIRNV